MVAVGAPYLPLYGRMVDRWVDFAQWPTNRKTALLTLLEIPSFLAIWAVSEVAGFTQLLDRGIWRTLAFGWLGADLLLLLLALGSAALAQEGRWTAYLYIFTHGLLVLAFLHAFGTTTTPLIVLYPLGVVMVMLFYDEWAGWVVFGYGAVLLLALGPLELSGALPYAPIFEQRTLDAQVIVPVYGAHFAIVTLVSAYVLLVSQFSISVRKAHQDQLRRAHDELACAKKSLERGNQLIRRYVPKQIADRMLSGEYVDADLHERRKVTLVFSDIEGFTATADRMEPEDLSALLNEYLSEMVRIAETHGATVNQFIGDAIMILFGAPQDMDLREQALRAVRMSLEMQERMRELRTSWFERGVQAPFRIRIGINTGTASVGNFGAPGRLTCSAIGNQTNLAARIQSRAKPGRVLIGHSTWALVKDEIPCVERGELEVKGVHYPVRVYEVVGAAS